MRVLDAADLQVAASLLADGEVVAVPTDTVYGLAAKLEAAAVDRLFAAKDRPRELPIAVLCARDADLAALGVRLDEPASRLAARFWPGPLTLVVDADASVCRLVGATDGLGVRVPGDERCRALLAMTGPLAVTSANRSGERPATTASEVVASGVRGVAAVLDGGICSEPPSTVADVRDGTLRVLRHGGVSAGALEEAIS